MRLFSATYDKALIWAVHPHTPRCLRGLSFAESSFFPFSPDGMLAPMLRKHIDRLGWITVLGALTLYVVLRD